MTTTATGAKFSFSLSFVPASKKNGLRRGRNRKTGQVILHRSKEVSADERAIGILAIQAMRQQGTRPFGDHEVAMDVKWDVTRKQVHVTLEDLGPRTGPYRRQDLANISAVILDALQGVAFDDDRQVARLVEEVV